MCLGSPVGREKLGRRLHDLKVLAVWCWCVCEWEGDGACGSRENKRIFTSFCVWHAFESGEVSKGKLMKLSRGLVCIHSDAPIKKPAARAKFHGVRCNLLESVPRRYWAPNVVQCLWFLCIFGFGSFQLLCH